MGVESQSLALGKWRQNWGAVFWSDGARDVGPFTGQMSPAPLDSICLCLRPGGLFSGSGILLGDVQMAEWEEGTYFSPLGDLALRRRSEVTWLQCSLPAGATWKNFSPSFAWKPSLLLGPGA